MKILMVCEDLPGHQVGGLGKHVVTLANALLAHGHHVDILGRADVGDPVGHAHWPAALGYHGHLEGGFTLPHPGWKELQMGVFNPLKRPWFAARIGRAITRHAGRYDVVHYHGHLPMVGLHADRALNFVQTRHDQGSECLTHLRFRAGAVCTTTVAADCSACIHAGAGPLRRAVTAFAVDGYRSQTAAAFRAQKTIFVSDFLRRQFLRAVPAADLGHSRVIHNVIDYAAVRAQAAGACATPGQVLLAGRIDAGKGFGDFLGAARAAAPLPPHACLLIVGDGPERAALDAAHASAQHRFLGWRPQADVLALGARSQLCVVPSVCEEACSTTVLEALALGKVCIALRRGGTPELAAYQQYPDQLRLGANMGELVALMHAELARAPVQRPRPPAFGADVDHALPALLELYAA
jgi:glycosyltransferase involved in cell wall biosynthesis